MTLGSQPADERNSDNVVPLRKPNGEAPWARFDVSAERDEFTNLAGHPWFVEDVRGAARRRRGGDNPWVAVARVEGLAGVAERVGSDATGIAIQAVAVRLHESLRAGDQVARIGPNRFGMLVNAPFADEASAALDRIRHNVRALVEEYPQWSGLDLRVGFAPLWSEDPEVAIASADAALERACKPGGHPVILSTQKR